MPVFLFTDIVGSTQLWNDNPELMSKILDYHDEIMRETITKFNGKIIKHTGDGIFAILNIHNSLQCVIEIQNIFQNKTWDEIGELKIRTALHSGDAEEREGDYFGITVNHTQRLLEAGWGGQILLTRKAIDDCELPENAKIVDLGSHILKDLKEPEHIFMLTHPELIVMKYPPLKTINTQTNNLPTYSTPFIGREDEMEEIIEYLKTPSKRILTIIGMGGIGKTRLACQIASEIIEEFPNGVFFIPLDSLTKVSQILSSIANIVGFQFSGKLKPETQLLNYLSNKKMLLIIDNFEHLLEGTTIITEILQGCPDIKIIITSRERLNISGEHLYELGGLTIPENSSDTDFENYSAVRLLIESIKRIRPDFKLQEKDKSIIIRICEFVEGLPLGIELSSSWIRVLSLSEILDEIEKDYSFLTTKRRDIPERQRSIRVIFNYTWKILNTKEKNVFKKLSVFRGSFNKKAGAKVAGASISILSSLVDKSILKHNRMGCFEMHRLLRNFGEEKLNENPEEKKLAEKLHSEFYGDLLKEIKTDLISITKPEITEKLDRELDDIKKGWELAVEDKYYDNLSKYISTLPYYFHIKSMFKDGLEMFSEAIDTLELERIKIGDNKIRDEFYCRLLLSKCWMLNYLGLKGELKDLTDKSIKIATQYKLKSEIAQSNLYFGLYYFTVGDLSKEEEYLNKALSLLEKVKDYWFISNCYNLLGGLNHRKSDIEKAEEMWNKSYEASEKLGDKVGMARALNNLGTIFAYKGDIEKEKYLYEKSLEYYRDVNNRLGISLATINLGLCYIFAGNYETAGELLKEAYKIREDIGNLMYIAESDFSLAINNYYSGDLNESKRLFFKILETTKENNYRLLSARALKYLGIISNDENNHNEALKYLRDSIDIIGDKKTDEIISIYGHLGLTHFRLNNQKQSNEYFKKAFKTISETNLIYKVYLFEIVFNYANILVEENTEKAVELLSFLINQPETKIHYYKERAKNTLSQINTKIPKNSFNKSIERGNSLTFNEIVDNILEIKSR